MKSRDSQSKGNYIMCSEVLSSQTNMTEKIPISIQKAIDSLPYIH